MNSRVEIQEFYPQELLYKRCKQDDEENPFLVTLAELSINRQGPPDDVLSFEDDVLFNIDVDDPNTIYEGFNVLKMIVKRINPDCKTYYFVIVHDEKKVEMKLLHDPLDCNYAHSVFRIWFNEVIVTMGNYSETLGQKKPKVLFSKIRDGVRQELAGMIVRKEVALNSTN